MIPYNGPGLLDANGNFLRPCGIIKEPLTLGSPTSSFSVEFFVIDSLPYSCILGLSFLNKLKSWGVDKETMTFQFNDSFVAVSHDPPLDNMMHLTLTRKLNIPAGQSMLVSAVARGPALSAFRPIMQVSTLVEGHIPFEQCLQVTVLPTLHLITHQNCVVHTTVVNNADTSRTIGKGMKIAIGHTNFHQHSAFASEAINLISHCPTNQPTTTSTTDPLDMLCSHIQHLPCDQFLKAKQVLSDFKDVFSVSNTQIGLTNISSVDVELEHSHPISMPLQRVPLHPQDIVCSLLQQYKDLGLIEHIDSPYRAATVLVEKKNVSNSSHLTGKYCLVVDYRFLNKAIKDSAWPAPSLHQCLDAAAGSKFLSSIDFNSGYHQIPCTNSTKPLLAFSPGYGFGQWTWNVMPQGIKSASSKFQQTMEKTFADHQHRILPPFYDDIIIKGITFHDHINNVVQILNRIRECGFTLNALKCKFFQIKLPCLGHIIDNGSIRIDPSRIQEIADLPTPQDVKSLRHFLGMAQFCERFISNFSVISAPLHDLTKPNVPMCGLRNVKKLSAPLKISLPLLRSYGHLIVVITLF